MCELCAEGFRGPGCDVRSIPINRVHYELGPLAQASAARAPMTTADGIAEKGRGS
eukprot:gene31427-17464_t